MTYNLTNLTSSNNFLDYSIAVNQFTDGMLFAMFIVVIGVVVYSRLDGSDTQKIIASLFLCFVMSTVLNVVGLLGGFYVGFFLTLLIISFIPAAASRFG